MGWFWLIFIATNLMSISTLFDKFFCSKKFKNPLSYMTLGTFLQIIFVLILSLSVSFKNLSGRPLIYAILSGPVFLLMWLFYFKAIQKVEVSRGAAIFNVSVIFTTILAILLLKERLTTAKYLAIFLIFIGAIICSYENNKKERFNLTYLLVIFAAFFAAIGGILSKLASFKIDPLVVYLLSFYPNLPFFFFLLTKKEIAGEIKALVLNKKNLIPLFLGRLFNFLAICFFYSSLKTGPISLVIAVNSTSPLFVFIYSTLLSLFFPRIIKEKITKEVLIQKLVAIVLIVGGVIIINF